ncbi:MAG: NB-ARC domain-containing protein, partial [Actinomycetota bacterium]|nr:NB-ARC domain-containing protein [Actinomycetota bacterium]
MTFEPVRRAWEQRVDKAREDSESLLFRELLTLGEMVTKIVCSGLVAAIADDRDNHRYAQLYRLVRADGIGEWAQAIDEVVVGPTSSFLLPEARDDQRQLTQNQTPASWQYESVALMQRCLNALNLNSEGTSKKIPGRRWFSDFAFLRNKTRGHGAPPSRRQAEASPYLEESIRLLVDNFLLFQRPWAYLHQKLSGVYRITGLTPDVTQFEHLKSVNTINIPDGVYLYLGRPLRVELIRSDVDASDFFFPNGGWNEKRFELLSYLTDERLEEDAAPYMAPTSTLPASKTEGVGKLDPQGKTFGNLPPETKRYVRRDILERELHDELLKADRHPIVTLVGRGGIGKTSLALSVLHRVANQEKYGAIVWFSARDIDLLPEGPKRVQQRVFTKKEIAEQFADLMAPSESTEKDFKPLAYFSEALQSSPLSNGGESPLLFVFDNFETVQNPVELFEWIDTYVRLPNKVLITTRFRDFRSDYPIDVPGMSRPEAERLMDATAEARGVRGLLNEQYREKLYNESDGHPYVIKILLGEVAKAGKLVPVPRIMEGKDRILNALFERTFQGLSPAARRIYLTLCSWRSIVPQLALEAILLQSSEEKMDVEEAVEELERSSFVEIAKSGQDSELFVAVPLAASLFGRRKLEGSPLRNKVEADKQMLQEFGASKQSDVRSGIAPRIRRLFSYVARRPEEIESRLPMLEFIARRYPPAWQLLVSLHEESGTQDRWENAKYATRQYLEFSMNERDNEWAWNKLADLCQRTGDYSGEIHALVERCQLPNASLQSMSYAAGHELRCGQAAHGQLGAVWGLGQRRKAGDGAEPSKAHG